MGGVSLGILGGSFDPVHNGHLLLASAALEHVGLDRLVVVPAARSPFKAAAGHAPDALRLAMLHAAFEGLDGVHVDAIELRRGGVSYTVDTVRALARAHGEARLGLIVGSDALLGLPRWRDADDLARRVHLLVAERPGTALPDVARLREALPELRVTTFPMPRVDLSSRGIRARVAAGRPLHGYVPPAVAALIRDHGLYRSEGRGESP